MNLTTCVRCKTEHVRTYGVRDPAEPDATKYLRLCEKCRILFEEYLLDAESIEA